MADPKVAEAGDLGVHSTEFANSVLPSLLRAIQGAIPALAKTQLETEQEISPKYNELLTSLYEKFAPRLAKTGSDIESGQRKSTAEADLSILSGPGKSIGREAESLNREFNPEYYSGRETASKKLGELLTSVNLNDANPEAERLVSQEAARSGGLTTPSATGTVSNALSFGNELQKRRNSLGQALSIASGFLPTTQSNVGIGFTGGTIGRNPSGTGVSQFAGVKGTDASTQGQNVVSGVYGQGSQAAGLHEQLNQQRRDAMDRVNEGVGAVGY